MSAEFNWWLLIVGLIAGGALTWLVLAESTRREREIGDEELAAEAAWIARSLHHEAIDGEVARDVLQAHRRYLGFPPPDALVDADELAPVEDHAPVEGQAPVDEQAAVSAVDDPGASLVGDTIATPAVDENRASPADRPASGASPGTDASP